MLKRRYKTQGILYTQVNLISTNVIVASFSGLLFFFIAPSVFSNVYLEYVCSIYHLVQFFYPLTATFRV